MTPTGTITLNQFPDNLSPEGGDNLVGVNSYGEFKTPISSLLNGVSGRIQGISIALSGALNNINNIGSGLNTKQVTGNYATTNHTHAVSSIIGLQSSLDAKQPVGNYANVEHGHAISDISDLQSSLDAKQTIGNYANATHSHAISEVSGLQPALDLKQASGNYSLVGHGHNVSDISGINLDLDLCNFSGALAVQSGDCDCDLSLAIDTRVSRHLVELFNNFNVCQANNPPVIDPCLYPKLTETANG
jgi:hypothetical protein